MALVEVHCHNPRCEAWMMLCENDDCANGTLNWFCCGDCEDHMAWEECFGPTKGKGCQCEEKRTSPPQDSLDGGT